MIGVRRDFGKDTIETIHQAIGDTAESASGVYRNMNKKRFAMQYGDPVDSSGDQSDFVILLLGKAAHVTELPQDLMPCFCTFRMARHSVGLMGIEQHSRINSSSMRQLLKNLAIV